ncbi:M14 family zinc carboxypeptidase [Halopiger aswanensis]|uniref:Zinc carboxypeptidase n=1 Tax=Halopiger aswanensis TaxID=148449 RepID=A0A419W0B4_9EURY|nr:M14 family zinc carboxypeptidase [Halopiger aswanensis]RKD88918.1 zinc carboxypeptidase [Halopiger aswanensis]
MELEKRDFLKALGGIAALTTAGSASARSDRHTDDDFELEDFARAYLNNDDVLDNRELETLLHRLENENPELVTVDQIGQSNQGRPLYSVSVGKEKNPSVLAIGQQHGDEYFMAEGLLAVAQFLTSGDPRAERILENRTVHLVPRVNPDGFVVPHRYNIDPEAPEDDPESGIFQGGSGIFAADEPGVGWDINRYNRHDWTQHELYQNFPEEYPENPVPEAVAIHAMMDEVDPEWVIDFHRMGSFMVDYESEWPGPEWARDDTDDDAEDETEGFVPPDPNDPGDGYIGTGAMLWPLHEDVDPEIRELSKQLVVTMRDDLIEPDDELRRVEYVRYPGGTYGGIARNGHALAGYGSVLVEVAGGTLGDRLFRARQPFDAMLAAAEATADGSLYTVDTARVDELPEAGTDVGIEEDGAE